MLQTACLANEGRILLTDEQIQQYRTDGYVLVPDALEPGTLAALRQTTEELVATARGATEHTEVLDLDPRHTPSRPSVRRIKHPYFAHPFFRRLASDAAIMSRLTPLIGEDIRLRTGGKVNLKPPGDGAAIEWHQDWAFYPHTNQSVLAVGVLLDDAGADNGPLMVLPGTHRGAICDHHSDGAFCGAIDVRRAGLDMSTAREIHGTAGSISIHHARLVHGSAVNRSDRARRMLFYVYAAADAWPLSGIDDLETFDGMIVHGRPTLEPRLENVPVRMPLPAAPNQGSIYENQRTLANRYFAS